MDDNRGKVLFVLVDSTGKYGPLYRQQFPDLRNATFFVSQSGESRSAGFEVVRHLLQDGSHTINLPGAAELCLSCHF